MANGKYYPSFKPMWVVYHTIIAIELLAVIVLLGWILAVILAVLGKLV